MSLNMIWAMGKNREIGLKNDLPWHLPEDLLHFKKITAGKPVIMGLRTYESLGRPLPGRKNIVINFSKIDIPGCTVVTSIQESLDLVNKEDAFIIGGASIYKQFLPYADKLYITYIDHDFLADTFFPDFDIDEWILVSQEKGNQDENNPFEYYFRVYDRKQ
ncbi:MAG: dihydrofolate reductase [archaeon]